MGRIFGSAWFWFAMCILSIIGHFMLVKYPPVPSVDLHNFTFVAKDPHAQEALVRAFSRVGMIPQKIDTPFARRAMYGMSSGFWMIDALKPGADNRFAGLQCGAGVVSSNPESTAAELTTSLMRDGYYVEPLRNFDSGIPQGALIVLKTNALPGGSISIRKPFYSMGDMPSTWNDQ